jgi:choline-sulfatase
MCGAIGVEVPEDVLLKARRAHYASISWVDDQVAALVGALEAEGVRDDTVVVFMADHGEMLGERGDWYKMSFFEPSAGVPLIFNAPGRFAPGRVNANVSLLDLAPTLVDLAGAESGGLQGTSLFGELDDRSVYGEYLAEGAVAPVVMVKRAGLKYIASPADPELLFDLDADPDELRNAAGDPKYGEALDGLKDEAARRWDVDLLGKTVLESQRARRLVADAMRVGEAVQWDLGDADGPYVRGEDFWAPFKRFRQ